MSHMVQCDACGRIVTPTRATAITIHKSAVRNVETTIHLCNEPAPGGPCARDVLDRIKDSPRSKQGR